MMNGIAGMAMWLMMGLMLLGLAAGGVAWARRRLRGGSAGSSSGDSPQEILRRRYAAGEIDRDEYLRRQNDLTGR